MPVCAASVEADQGEEKLLLFALPPPTGAPSLAPPLLPYLLWQQTTTKARCAGRDYCDGEHSRRKNQDVPAWFSR